ncbi:hypothetical protein CL619_03715 [archaeon]|nr:hypothetical protein [archaeon]|tara:strand:- start:61 stop:1002 length:942 start_codon:yes stop_codon:yes gene_type:complete
MNLATRIEQTGQYLNRYLEAFIEEEQESDVCWIAENGTVAKNPFPPFRGEYRDFHTSWFKGIYDSLPSVTLPEFAKAVAESMDSPLIIEVGGLYGSDFSLWAASQNPSAEVRIFNPVAPSTLMEYLFNDIRAEELFKLKNKTPFDPNQRERSINRLFDANGLSNVRFVHQGIDYRKIQGLVEEAGNRQVLLYSRRPTRSPFNVIPIILDIAQKYDNVELLMTPFIDGPAVPKDSSDLVMQKIAKHMGKFQELPRTAIHDPNESAVARIYLAMSQYVCLDFAQKVGAEVYREDHFIRPGYPFYQPTHHVSTVKP